MTPAPDYRRIVGRSSELWRGDGHHVVEESRWLTLSGLPSVDYNVACCYGPGVLAESMEDIATTGARSVILAAERALGDVQVLADAGWVCIGSTPLMRLALGAERKPGSEFPPAEVLGEEELQEVRSIVVDAFGIDPAWADVAVPDRLVAEPHQRAWGLRGASRLDSVLLAVDVERTVVVWSMATRVADHGRGLGRRLLDAVADEAAGRGMADLALYASPAGERLYTGAGFETLEHLQQWSRPRWVLGRS